MNFYKIPFVFITVLIILGLEFQTQMKWSDTLVAGLLGLSLFMVFVLERINRLKNWKPLFFAFAISFLGAFLMSMSQQNSKDEVNFSKTATLLVEIDEIAPLEKVWRKALCTVKQIIDSNSVVSSKEQILLFINSKKMIQGDQILANVSVELIENKNNPGEFDAKRYWSAKNIRYIGFVSSYDYKLVNHAEISWYEKQITQTRSYLNKILEEHLSENELAIAQALILGNKGMLSSELKTSFSKAGAMHVLAVSGLHVGIVLFLLMYVLKQFPRLFSKKSALFTSLMVIWIYAGITGFSPSVLRATIMFTILSLGIVLGRKGNGINVLFFSAFLLIVWNPMIIYDLGFQLSYLAMIGIFTLYGPISGMFYIKNKYLRKIWEGTAVGIAAQLVTFPLTLYYFHQFPNYFMLTNVGMMVFAGLTLSIGLLLFAVNGLGIIAQFVGVLLAFCLGTMLFFIQFIENLPGSVAKGFEIKAELVLIIYCIILAFFLFKKKRKVVFSLAILSLLIFSSIQYSRFQNLSTNEVVVYNSNELIVSIKIYDEIICFRKEKEKSIKEANYLVGNYEKIKPGKINMQTLKKGTTKIALSNHEIELNYSFNGLHLKVNDSSYFIRTSHKINEKDSSIIIDMPYLQENPEHIQLANGAFILKIKH